jgi:signal transduction histidine kinase
VNTTHSAREVQARARAAQRLHRQRELLRPLGLLVIVAVAVGAFNGQPAPAAHGRGLGIAVAFVVFAVALALAVRGSFVEQRVVTQTAVIAAMGAAGVALVALQPHGATELAGGAAVWMAVTRLPLPIGPALAAATTVGLGLAEALAGGSPAAVTAGLLLCALLGLVAYFVKQARAGQDTTEILLAELEDAREQQLETAALAERSRIAGELHDVLAHALSGAALQLQGARMLAERDDASPEIRAALDRAAELVRDGLVNARQAVGALRGDRPPGIDQLESLVTGFRTDAGTDVTLTIEGRPRPLSVEGSLALYRGAQEALTNVGRYAPGAATRVILRYGTDRTTLTIEDSLDQTIAAANGLAGVGGGNGLRGLRERLERVGGSLDAGPTDHGWLVQLEIPT